MSKNKFSQKESYDIIVSDSEALIKYVDELKKGKKIGGNDSPEIVKLYLNPDDKKLTTKKEEQIKLATSVGGTGAMVAAAALSKAAIGVGGSMVGGSLIGGAGVAAGGAAVASFMGGTLATGLGIAGMATTSLIPIIGVPILAAGLGITIGKAIYNFKNKEKSEELNKRLEKSSEYLSEVYMQKERKYAAKYDEYRQMVSDLLKKYTPIVKDKARKAAIIADDALHIDVNKRIMQYQQIALNQYKDIKSLNENFAELQDKYNETVNDLRKLAEAYEKLEEENRELLVELEKYRRIISAIETKRAYLSSDKSEEKVKK